MTHIEIENHCLSKPAHFFAQDDVLLEMVDHAYAVVVSKLPKYAQRELNGN